MSFVTLNINSIRFVTLFLTLISVCYAQQPKQKGGSDSLGSRWKTNSTLSSGVSVASGTAPLIRPNPATISGPVTSGLLSSSWSTRTSSAPPQSSSAPPKTVTVSNGETIEVAAGVLVLGGAGGGFFLFNGAKTWIPAGATAIAGSGSNNPDPENQQSDNLDQETTRKPRPSSSLASTVQASKTSSGTSTSSATPSSTGADYIIFAKEGTTKMDADGFYNTLAGLVGKANIESIFDEFNTPIVWRAPLTPPQLDQVKADRVIAGVEPNQILAHDDVSPDPASTQPSTATQQKRAEVSQAPSDKNDIFDLRTLSTPPNMDGTLPDYRYDDFAGEGITIYIIDTGPFVLNHDEFEAPAAEITRRELNVAKNKKFTLDDTHHGTCVASKAVGKMTGAAKRANLVAVRIEFTNFGLISGFQAALNEIKQKGLKGKAVVSTSVLVRPPDSFLTTSIRNLIKSLVVQDVPIVTAAGNYAAKGIREPDKLPAILAKELPIIVVGSANQQHEMAQTSQRGGLLTTWAVGDNIKCADVFDLSGLTTDSGTSFAAPQVAGIAAYWMSHPEFNVDLRPGKVATDMRDIMGALSFPRIKQPGYPPIAWNGYDLGKFCDAETSSVRARMARRGKRDLDQACSYAPSSAPGTVRPTSAPTTGPIVSRPGSSTTTSITTEATSVPACGVCGQELPIEDLKILGGQVGCSGAEYAQQSCEATDECKSWAFGLEDRQTYKIEVCLLFTSSASDVVRSAPPGPKGECPFKYYDKDCSPQPSK